MASGKWVWDAGKKALRFDKDKSRSYDLKGFEKFKYKRRMKSKAGLEENKDRLVTLNDIKRVAVQLISDETLQMSSQLTTRLFDECCNTKSMDTLLWCTLKYYANLTKYRVASTAESLEADGEVAMKAKAILKECSQNMKQCESDLSAAYILLISGTAAEYTHHSLKGQLRYSRTLVDQQFYEIIYEYLMLVTWITYSYEKWDDIHSEIGRFLRSNSFNKEIPISPPPDVNYTRHRLDEELITAKIYDNRPDIGNLKKFKSPLAEVLYPTLHDSKSLGKPLPRIDDGSLEENIGIIGEVYSDFVPETLKLRYEVILERQLLEEEMRFQAQLQNNISDEEYEDTDSEDTET